MEQVLGTVIVHDTVVLSFLIAGIAIVLLILLIFNFSNPESVILSEYGRSDEFESTLRRVLGAKLSGGGGQRRSLESASSGEPSDPGELAALEAEVLEKDQKIAELQKMITAGAGGSGRSEGLGDDASSEHDDSALKEKIADLEGRLEEYEIIEDDIADLSKYKIANEQLQAELAQLRSQMTGEPSPVPEPVAEASEEAPDAEPEFETAPQMAASPPAGIQPIEPPSGEDLVAEFEKIVSQGSGNDTQGEEGVEAAEAVEIAEASDGGSVAIEDEDAYGDVMMAKLAEMNAEPDSKEEAEVLINDLKILKKGAGKAAASDEKEKSDGKTKKA